MKFTTYSYCQHDEIIYIPIQKFTHYFRELKV